jgi:hypothetical protein
MRGCHGSAGLAQSAFARRSARRRMAIFRIAPINLLRRPPRLFAFMLADLDDRATVISTIIHTLNIISTILMLM